MSDPNHVWNDGSPIRIRKRPCGCCITKKTIILCRRGQDLKKSADSRYGLYQAEKGRAIDAKIIKAHLDCFEIHRDAYLKHLE